MEKSKLFRRLIAIILIAFATLTLFMSSSVLFDWFGIRARQGNYVPFIVWINFITGLLYLVSSYGLFKTKKWSFWILNSIAFFLILALITLVLLINYGGLWIYELKTIKAMVFRIALTIIFSISSYFTLKKH